MTELYEDTPNSLEKRRQGILDIVNQLGEINFTKLRQYFPGVSDVTLRKDLKFLDDNHQLVRIHGGAKSFPQVINFKQRASLHQEEKGIIGAKAAKLIQPGNSIFLAAGTTCVELAKLLPSFPLYIVTDGLNTAAAIPIAQNFHMVILGGELDLNTRRIYGQSVLQQLDSMHFNIAFLGTPAFHPDYGFSNLSDINAAIAGKIIQKSERIIMLMDSSKVNYACSPWNTPLNAVDTIISDGKLEPDVTKKIRSAGVELL
mgnify:CR=1 FL=1